jgi:predicted dehydrogenase/threonine dehydrogenase-like Zn-dependent dehydrogenase
MQQLTQKLKNGDMQVLEVPMPQAAAGTILVRNHFSLISAGTEGSTVKTARTGFIGKAKERPQQVKQVIDTLRSQGITQTYRAVMKKLDAYSTLGYSTAGEVIGVGAEVTGFAVGDPVACGGLTAAHAEVVCVPASLCVRLRPGADFRQAAYNTLGAIAMQGVRQADLRIGESCAIIGMGLLGQLTALILRAGGIRVVAVDIDPAMVKIAGERCAELALCRDDIGISGKISQFTDGLGCDSVIITAATVSLDPVNFAGEISRKRGTVVIVGAVPTGFDRDPHYYRKELQMRMSCSYGPGRYDPSYEDKGIDYPAAYVRWTENRNMQAFQELIASGRIDVSYLTTHVFDLDEAPAAYDLLMEKSEPYLGMLLQYNIDRPITVAPFPVKPSAHSAGAERVAIGFIGAGSYAQSHLIPNIPLGEDVFFRGVMTATPTGARSVSDRYGFQFCTGSAVDILADEQINTLFIASRHDSHADYVLQALKAGKHVFVEKPLCLCEDELTKIAATWRDQEKTPHLMVGFNRRFAPLAKQMKAELGSGPLAMTYRVNAGAIPAASWIQDPKVGGGRIVGEVCHFIDFLTFLNGSLPVSLHATAMNASPNLFDTVTISLDFENGSIGSIAYFANGDKGLGKERVEVFGHGAVAILDDFKTLTIHGNGKKKEKKLLVQDKGQKDGVVQFIETLRRGHAPLISFSEIHAVTLATFRVLESIRSGQACRL